jgi:uncharacterized membrane protein HdeD (DUF308 family)
LKANLSSLGDGIIVCGVGAFVLTIAYVYYLAIQPSSSSSSQAVVVGFFVFGTSVLVAGILKIIHAFTSLRDEKQSNLKTPIASTVAVLIIFYYLSATFLFRTF